MSDDTALSPLDAPGIDAAVEAAVKALDAASAWMPEDRPPRARGERSPIRWPTVRSAVWHRPKGHRRKLLGQARASRLRARRAQAELEAERDARSSSRDRRRHAAHHRHPRGARHPLEALSERIADIFVAMAGRSRRDRARVGVFNFDALNFGVDHPARQMQDTFFIEGQSHASPGLVLRTHTSPVQARTLLERACRSTSLAPASVPHGRARRDAHARVPPGRGPGLDKGLTMANLKAP